MIIRHGYREHADKRFLRLRKNCQQQESRDERFRVEVLLLLNKTTSLKAVV